jgi:type IV secretory pathway VirB4 component
VQANLNFIGVTEIDDQFRPIGLLPEDRRRHTYILGKSGMGKSTLMENMILQDILAGRGCWFY